MSACIIGCGLLVPGEPLVPCATDSECGLGQSCQSGFCRNEGSGRNSDCGDGFCEIGETVQLCRADCEGFTPGDAVCGNDFCELGESGTACPQDCEFGFPGEDVCGNDICELGESDSNCPFDCENDDPFECGDGSCDPGEALDCPTDCDDQECGPTCVSSLGCDDGDDCTNDDCVPAPSRCGLISVCRNQQIQCPFGQRCADGFCQIPQCFIDADCGLGRQCIRNICQQ